MSKPFDGRESLRTTFWRLAHSRYHSRKPSALFEVWLFIWFALWAVAYGGGLLRGWLPANLTEAVVGLVLVGAPLAIGLVHRRIRIEAKKGREALYFKWLETRR